MRGCAPPSPALLILSLLTACHQTALPLAEGEHVFKYRDAEFPDMDLGTVTVRLRGRHIVIVNRTAAVAPSGQLEEGDLQWHAKSKQWIIGNSEADATATEVGGCSNGPSVVDLLQKFYWTC